MSDIEFYELNVRKLGIDYYEFTERLAIYIDESIKYDADLYAKHPEQELEKPFLFVDAGDIIKNIVLSQFKKEQLLKLTKKLL